MDEFRAKKRLVPVTPGGATSRRIARVVLAAVMVGSALTVAGTAGAAPTSIDFESASTSQPLTTQLSGDGVTFPQGLEVYNCGPSSCIAARSGTNVVRGQFAGEFARDPLEAVFTNLQKTASVWVRSDVQFSPSKTIMATINAYNAAGNPVGSQTESFSSGATWQQLSVGSLAGSANIKRIVVSGGQTDTAITNFLSYDDLSFDPGDDPQPSPSPTTVDDEPPSLVIHEPLAGSIQTQQNVLVEIETQDESGLFTVNGNITGPVGEAAQIDFCGSSFSGSCPLTSSLHTFSQSVSLPGAPNGSYVVSMTACDPEANCTTATRTFVLDVITPVAPLEDFGYPATPVTGTRPLLTILMEFSDVTFDAGHNPDFYRRVLFATEDGELLGSVAGLGSVFDEMSDGQFFYSNEGVLGPFRHPDDPTTAPDESTYACAGGTGPSCASAGTEVRRNAIRAADAAGFPFDTYDTNSDGTISTEELTILEVFAEGAARRGGQTRALCVEVSGGKQVCTDSIGVGEAVGVATIAHELSHTLGIDQDAYGWNARLNFAFSLMGGTIVTPEDDRRMFHLDPFHKLRLGWLAPEVLTADRIGCFDLSASDHPPPSSGVPRSYILYDPARGTNEFYMLEHRLPMSLNYDGDPWFTGSFAVPDQGLGIWYVLKDGSDRLVTVPPYDGPATGSDEALYILPPSGTQGRPRFGNGLWSKGNGDASLTRLDISSSPPAWLDHPSRATVAVESDSVRRRTITFRLNSDVACPVEADPVPISGTAPAPDEGTCRIEGGRSICRLPGGRFFRLVRRMPADLEPGDVVRVRWTIVAKRRLARVRVVDRLDDGFDVLRKKNSAVLFKGLSKGDKVIHGYSIRLDPELMGRFKTGTVARFRPRPGADTRVRRMWTGVVVYDPGVVEGG